MGAPVEQVLERLREVTGKEPRRSGKGWSARCPAHDDKKPSLSVGVGADGKVLLRCHAGCPIETILGELGMTVSELFPGGEQQVRGVAASTPGDPIGELARRRAWCPGALLMLDATADGPLVRLPMRDHSGQVVGHKLRRGDGSPVRTQEGETKSKTEAGSQHGLFTPYPLRPDGPVAVVEGEADTAAGLSAGWLAVVGTAGANLGALARTALQLLVPGRECVLFPHSDGGGPTWLVEVGALLVNAGCEVRFVPADPKRGDLDERLRAVRRGERPAAMQALIESAVPWREKGKASGASWRILSLVDAYAVEEPLIQVVEGVIVRPSVSIVYGAPGVLKSFLVADMAMCVAGGLPWLPTGPSSNTEAKATSRVPALWLDFDNGRRRTAERVRALCTGHGLQPDTTPFHFVSMPSPWLDAASTDSVAMLRGVLRAHDIKLCVVDNLGAVCLGADENSIEMIGVMTHVRQLAEATESAIVLIHHQRKSTQFAARTGESLRGHSSIEAAIDLALLCERKEGSPQVAVRSTKSRDVDVAPFGALFRYEHKEGSNELAKAQFYGTPVEDTVSDQAVRNAVVATVKAKGTLNQRQLVDEVQRALPGAAYNLIRERADALVAEGALAAPKGAHGAKLYRVSRPASQVHGGHGKPP